MSLHPAPAADVRLALSRVTGWVPSLSPDPGSPVLASLVLEPLGARVAGRLGGVPLRVGESTAVLGLAARLWALTLGCAVRDGILPDPSCVVVQDDQGLITLGVREFHGWAGADPLDVARATVDALAPVIAQSRLAARLMWGNVVSPLVTTPRALGLPEAIPWVEEMLTFGPLKGQYDGRRRTTCCLFYLVPGGGLCGDCVLTHTPSRKA